MTEPINVEEGLALLERATGPDRGLDAMIHWQMLDGVGVGYSQDTPAYTASIDAAMTLAGQGGGCGEGGIPDDHPFAILNEAIMQCPLDRFDHLPRFICVAALKARAHQENQNG